MKIDLLLKHKERSVTGIELDFRDQLIEDDFLKELLSIQPPIEMPSRADSQLARREGSQSVSPSRPQT